MTQLTKPERLRLIIKNGVALLKEQKTYTQSTIQKKMKAVGKSIAAASLTNILTDKKVSLPLLQTASEGVIAVVEHELPFLCDTSSGQFVPDPASGSDTKVIPVPDYPDDEYAGFKIHKTGRFNATEKAGFIQTATEEIVEVGLRLKAFAGFFNSHKEDDYQNHLLERLKNGVHFKAYLLDPESQEARMYFTDRSKFLPDEARSIDEMRIVVKELQRVRDNIAARNLKGSFELYLYRHMPYGMFLMVDGATAHGKLLVSSYLYGVRRAHCPVLEIYKEHQHHLYTRYRESMLMLMADAKKI